jgi:hypothetical protein
VHTIISTHLLDDVTLEIDPDELKSAGLGHILFVARKAIGFLFTQPISAATILISLMRNTTDNEVMTNLGALLFNPLLLNFTGKVRDFAEQQSGLESGEVKATIDQALKDTDKYLEDLRSVGSLAALNPGEAQREAYHRYLAGIMAESWKAAESQSIFLDLVSRSVLLYGRKSIDYVYGPDGQSRRMEIPLQRHSTDMEFPRLQIVDPFGLDYMLRIFRRERLEHEAHS